MLQASIQASNVVPGRVLGDTYKLVRVIGRGGMGTVFEATQLRLNKRVAIKLMSRDLAASQTALRRFRREAEITSQLGHPHLVNVMDFGTADTGEPYMVMEFLEGEDLEQRIAREGRLSPESIVPIIRQAASALTVAHEREIVHRDMKPANIFLVAAAGIADYVKVLDFGISKMKAAETRLTKPNTAVGTPYYMSPEQATGKSDNLDQGADQWALACIAYECIAGRPPFWADNATAVLYQIVHMDPPPLAEHAPSLRPEAEQVLRRALSKRIAERYPSIRDFAYAFDTEVFDRPAEITLIPQVLPTPAPTSQPYFVGAGSASRGEEAPVEAAQKAPSGQREGAANGTKPPVPTPIPPIEVTSVVPRGWSKPRIVLTLVAGIAALFVGWFVLSKPAPPLVPAKQPATVAPVVVTPLPPPSVPAATASEGEQPPMPTATRAPDRKTKKQAGSLGDLATRAAGLRKGSSAPPAKETGPQAAKSPPTSGLPGGFRW